MTLQHLYHRLHLLLPHPVRGVLKTLVPGSVQERLDPLKDPNYLWPLHGSLTGYVFKLRNTAEWQYVLSDFEPSVCAAIERVVQSGWVCADIGANIGYLTLLMARCCEPGGKVYAFEALPSNAELARENVAINNLAERVVVENLAVSDGSASRVFLYEGDPSFEFSLLSRVGHTGGLEVSAVTLDSYFAGKDRLDFVKMDIEGAEGQAVRGMRHVLHNQRPTCLIEIHGELGMPAFSELISAGYTLFDLDGHPISHSDLSRESIFHILARPLAHGGDDC